MVAGVSIIICEIAFENSCREGESASKKHFPEIFSTVKMSNTTVIVAMWCIFSAMIFYSEQSIICYLRKG